METLPAACCCGAGRTPIFTGASSTSPFRRAAYSSASGPDPRDRDLRPERGPVDWRPVADRRRRAEARIQAVEDYARASHCRRARLVGYFGEQLEGCAGCDKCGKKTRVVPADPAVAARLARLRDALAGRKTVWGGCPLEPEVLLRLAKSPPPDAASLADVPGVGVAVTERLGGAILRALSSAGADPVECNDPIFSTLEGWRAAVAREMGVPAYAIVPDAVLRAIAEGQPKSRSELARIRGLGPRALAKFGDDLVHLVSSGRNTPPTHSVDELAHTR
jgi:hypothetical protein